MMSYIVSLLDVMAYESISLALLHAGCRKLQRVSGPATED